MPSCGPHSTSKPLSPYRSQLLLNKAEHLDAALWLCVAKDAVIKIASSAYKPGEITYNVEQADSQSEALRWLKARRDQCIASLQPLREAPVPESLAATRSAVLAAVGSAEPIWQTAWAEWEAAVRQPKEDAQDYDSVVATVQRKVDEQELLSYSLAAANDAIHEAEQKLGLTIDDAW